MSRISLALRRPWVAAAVLLAVYVGLSFAMDPRAYLGTDTGGKVATLAAMERNGWQEPDLGYWAVEADPDGTLHPLYYTERVGDRWVNATTLPMLMAAYPLWSSGGYRLALLVPMLGAVAAALAVRSIVQRAGGQGPAAFWLVGLASPLAVYALDLWEHALGLGLILWGAERTLAWWDQRSSPAWGLAVGLLFGAAATLRTEALLYGGVVVGSAGLVELVRHRRLGRPLIFGALALAGLVGPLIANQALEDAVIGEEVRVTRATGLAGRAGNDVGDRLDEALRTTFGLPGYQGRAGVVIGAAAVALIVVALRRSRPGTSADDLRLAALAALGVAGLYGLTLGQEWGFVPGLLTASPLAVAGLALAPRSLVGRLTLGMALVALPLVWATQFLGGAAPQWGSRYALTSSLLLAAVGVLTLERVVPAARAALVGGAVVITGFGLGWLAVRSHSVADVLEAVDGRDAVIVSRVGHLFREGGAFYDPGDRWLTAVTADDEEAALQVARRLAPQQPLVIAELDRPPAVEERRDAERRLQGYRLLDEEVVVGFGSVPFRIAAYEPV